MSMIAFYLCTKIISKSSNNPYPSHTTHSPHLWTESSATLSASRYKLRPSLWKTARSSECSSTRVSQPWELVQLFETLPSIWHHPPRSPIVHNTSRRISIDSRVGFTGEGDRGENSRRVLPNFRLLSLVVSLNQESFVDCLHVLYARVTTWWGSQSRSFDGRLKARGNGLQLVWLRTRRLRWPPFDLQFVSSVQLPFDRMRLP